MGSRLEEIALAKHMPESFKDRPVTAHEMVGNERLLCPSP